MDEDEKVIEYIFRLDEKQLKAFIPELINQAKQEERDKLEKNIGLLRQYLNERESDDLITDEELKTFLITNK